MNIFILNLSVTSRPPTSACSWIVARSIFLNPLSAFSGHLFARVSAVITVRKYPRNTRSPDYALQADASLFCHFGQLILSLPRLSLHFVGSGGNPAVARARPVTGQFLANIAATRPGCIRLRYERRVRVCRTENRASEWRSLTTWHYEISTARLSSDGAALVSRINIRTRAYVCSFRVPRILLCVLISLSLPRRRSERLTNWNARRNASLHRFAFEAAGTKIASNPLEARPSRIRSLVPLPSLNRLWNVIYLRTVSWAL